jgi:CRP/FNR family transcriptional regulator
MNRNIEKAMIDQEKLLAHLGSVFNFSDVREPLLDEIANTGQVCQIPAKQILFQEGESASGMYVLLKGQVRLSKMGLQGIESIVHTIKPVVVFNEITAIDRKPNPITAIADRDCVIWKISSDRCYMLMENHPELCYCMMQIMAERNRVILASYEDLISRPVLARTAKLLLNLSQGGQQTINRYEHPNQRIAALASTVPEAVSRSIKTLKVNQVIECTRAQIKILSREGLTEYALVEPLFRDYYYPN